MLRTFTCRWCRRFSLALVAITIVSSVATQGAAQQIGSRGTGTQRGATLGGLAGAVAGGLIGDNNDEAGAGAAIGGIIGAVTGGVLGNAADKDRVARQQQYYYQQQQVQSQQAVQRLSAVSVADVVNMSRSGLSDNVIMNQIQQRGVQQQLQVADIIALHQQGVRENVITAMQQARVGDVALARPAPTRAPVIVEQPTIIRETHVLPAYPVRRYYYPPRGGHYRGRPGTSIHFGF